MRAHRCAAALLLLTLRDAKARTLPHVVDGMYDTTWYAVDVTSLDGLRRVAPAHGWTVLAGLDDLPLTDDAEACVDEHEKCAAWAAVGECDANPAYMKNHCFVSCGTCPPRPSEPCGSVDGASHTARKAMRHAQRTLPARFLATTIAKRSEWTGPWPFRGGPGRACSAAIFGPRDDWAAYNMSSANWSDWETVRPGLAGLAHEASKVNEYKIENRLDREITTHWFDVAHEDGKGDDDASPFRETSTIPPGESRTIGTFIGHIFAVSDRDGFLGQLMVKGEGDAGIVDQSLLAEAETCSAGLEQLDPNAAAGQAAEMARLEAVEGPAGRDARVKFAIGERVRDLSLEKRKALSDVQINHVRNVTVEGFKLMQTPAHIYDRVRDFYNKSYYNMREAESDGGPLYNQHLVTNWHTPLPPATKRYVFDELKYIMEDWAPTTAPLRGTSAYGVRTYEAGSYLHLHVDTANTHVVSGIMNVAQDLGEGEDWPLEILDHDGELHAVAMKPGDLLLYESAKLLHGRPRPFSGVSYANVFVHYCPESGWDPRL